jgi:hypothetical protein
MCFDDISLVAFLGFFARAPLFVGRILLLIGFILKFVGFRVNFSNA